MVGVVIARGEVEVGGPDDIAVELVDRGRPRVRAERARVARPRRAVDPAPSSCEYELWFRLVRRAGACKPRVCLSLPAACAATDADALPDDAADVRVVDSATQGRLEGGHGERFRVVVRGGPERLGDQRSVPDRVEVCLMSVGCRSAERGVDVLVLRPSKDTLTPFAPRSRPVRCSG